MLLLFRIVCAVFVAWAMSWAMARPEAAALREELPLFLTLAPLAGAIVGFLNLARRQGWGMIVAVANGLWAGALSLILAGAIGVGLAVREAAAGAVEFDFENLLRVASAEIAVVVDLVATLPFVVITLSATAVVGLVTEVIHWALVRLRKRRPRDHSSQPQ